MDAYSVESTPRSALTTSSLSALLSSFNNSVVSSWIVLRTKTWGWDSWLVLSALESGPSTWSRKYVASSGEWRDWMYSTVIFWRSAGVPVSLSACSRSAIAADFVGWGEYLHRRLGSAGEMLVPPGGMLVWRRGLVLCSREIPDLFCFENHWVVIVHRAGESCEPRGGGRDCASCAGEVPEG